MDIHILWLLPSLAIGWVIGALMMANEAMKAVSDAQVLDENTIGYWGREK